MAKTDDQTPKKNLYELVSPFILLILVAIVFYVIGNQQIKTNNETIAPTSKEKPTEKIEEEVNQDIEPTEALQENQPIIEPTVEQEPIEEPVVIYKQGNLDIDPNKSADLDKGLITNSNRADIKFLVDGVNNVRGIAFSVGIKYYDWGTAEISNGKESCKSVQFITSNPPGGSVVLSDDIRSGENFCYITNGGRYGTFKVLQAIKQAGKVRIYFTTWE